VVPVEAITARARQIKPGEVAVAIVGGLLFAAGWLVMGALRGAWFVLAFIAAGFMTGWDRNAGRAARPRRGDLVEEIERLRAELGRFTDQSAGGPGLAGPLGGQQ
jgi:hypothetical protein